MLILSVAFVALPAAPGVIMPTEQSAAFHQNGQHALAVSDMTGTAWWLYAYAKMHNVPDRYSQTLSFC